MTLSMSRSTKQLIVLALPAAKVPPTRVATTSHHDGMPRRARIMAGTVVTRSNSMMRGLVRATYALTSWRAGRRPVGAPGRVGASTVTRPPLPTPSARSSSY